MFNLGIANGAKVGEKLGLGFWVYRVQIWHYFCTAELAIPGEVHMLELTHVMKLQDFLSSGELWITNESQVDEINIEIKIEPSGVGIVSVSSRKIKDSTQL